MDLGTHAALKLLPELLSSLVSLKNQVDATWCIQAVAEHADKLLYQAVSAALVSRINVQHVAEMRAEVLERKLTEGEPK